MAEYNFNGKVFTLKKKTYQNERLVKDATGLTKDVELKLAQTQQRVTVLNKQLETETDLEKILCLHDKIIEAGYTSMAYQHIYTWHEDWEVAKNVLGAVFKEDVKELSEEDITPEQRIGAWTDFFTQQTKK